jgi:DNA-binding NarL/FixJ family response regulator
MRGFNAAYDTRNYGGVCCNDNNNYWFPKNRSAKLTEGQVREIKILLSEGVTQKEIAKKFKVTNGCISAIATGKSWNKVKI